ncbi:MAG TPA: hypothetical protein VM123_18895, partial [archaeon]|nr:hypothetical protein [archaeon]
MRSKVEIDAGICGFKTIVEAKSEDNQYVEFDIVSDCEKIHDLGQELQRNGAIDSYNEINPVGRSIVMETGRLQLKGCCAGCVVPAGIFKGMQVAAG